MKLIREYKCYQKHCITCTFTSMQTTKNMTFHACTCIVRLQVLICYVNTHLQNVNKTSGFECCFWSTQSVERQARTSDNVKTGVFISLNVQWWSFIDNVVYCNILRSIKAAFFEIEKAMFTGVTLVPMFTIITPGPYTHSKQSKSFDAKCNLKVYCEKNWLDNWKWL